MTALSYGSPHLLIATKIFLLLYNLWNLDLLRSVIPDICLNVTTLQALALDYLIALYPFVLILLSYILIDLHDRQFAVVVNYMEAISQGSIYVLKVLGHSHINY